MESTLRQAAERGELILQYQPKYDLGTRQLVGVEALVRWNHPTLGLVPPARFIPLAEETGLIGMVGEWVFRAACAQARRWREAGCRMQVSINVSARQFREPDLANRMLAIMAEIGVDAAGIELELTESVFMEDATRAVSTLERLKAAGVRIAIDDFGTGYSSLSYLQRLPLDVLKIDQSFIQNLSEGPDNAAIVKAVIHMARSLGIEVVAEGVETERHANYLGAWGCTYGQGFFFGRPMAAEDVIARSATAH
ncbi:MAG: EAL domain-containing protein [Burkholderiales bacterium]|nr:EAL domain-containing protein [Burkholderiales bacterium]